MRLCLLTKLPVCSEPLDGAVLGLLTLHLLLRTHLDLRRRQLRLPRLSHLTLRLRFAKEDCEEGGACDSRNLGTNLGGGFDGVELAP